MRDADLIESALARPMNRYHDEPSSDLADPAAAYLFGLVKNHGYVDGNKRTGFASAATFLIVSGQELTASEACDVVIGVADGRVSEEELAEWIRRNTRL